MQSSTKQQRLSSVWMSAGGVNTTGVRVNIFRETVLIIHVCFIVYDDVSGCLPINNNIPCRIDPI